MRQSVLTVYGQPEGAPSRKAKPARMPPRCFLERLGAKSCNELFPAIYEAAAKELTARPSWVVACWKARAHPDNQDRHFRRRSPVPSFVHHVPPPVLQKKPMLPMPERRSVYSWTSPFFRTIGMVANSNPGLLSVVEASNINLSVATGT
jgi:hypothetical protein